MNTDLPPWLDGAQRVLEEAFSGARPPHALLLRAAEGLGADWLATWIAARVLCQASAGRPCGICKSCSAIERGNHPDLFRVSPLEDSKQIRIDEVRELGADLALKSHQGGYKVAIVHPAEALNVNAANALLKTLEEPSGDTLLVLVTHRRARLPATIVSRCQQLNVPAPSTADATAWLEREFPGGEGAAALRFARGAPLRAAELAARNFAALDREMLDLVGRLERGALDIPAVSDQWTRSAKADLPDRTLWLETWVTENVLRAMAGADSGGAQAISGLPAANETLKIRGLYRVLDHLRRMKIVSQSSLNMTMAVESLLLDLETALAGRPVVERSGGGRR
ncbi:MAG TPA: DNA polymerase III subunit delta' [Steroidobacteraceae bacterium]|nr:DNA polymerase III subunit delta' [Steroidobacteraceae bacterium]